MAHHRQLQDHNPTGNFDFWSEWCTYCEREIVMRLSYKELNARVHCGKFNEVVDGLVRSQPQSGGATLKRGQPVRRVCVTGLSAAPNAAAEGIKHDGQIGESLWPSARRSMSATQNLSHASRWTFRSTKSGAGRAFFVAPFRCGTPTPGNLACGRNNCGT